MCCVELNRAFLGLSLPLRIEIRIQHLARSINSLILNDWLAASCWLLAAGSLAAGFGRPEWLTDRLSACLLAECRCVCVRVGVAARSCLAPARRPFLTVLCSYLFSPFLGRS